MADEGFPELDDLDDLDDDLGAAGLGADDGEDLPAKAKSKSGPVKKAKKAADPNAPHIVMRLLLGLAGLMLIVGFALPWIRLDAVNPQLAAQGNADQYLAGYDIAMNGGTMIPGAGDAVVWPILWLIPLFGAALAAIGFLGNRWSGLIGALFGLLVVGYGLVTVIMLFFQTTSYGLWTVLGGAFVAVAGGTFAWARSRTARPASKKR